MRHATCTAYMLGASAFPFNDRTAILGLERRYWSIAKAPERLVEEAIDRSMAAARRRGHLTKGEFIRIAEWKSKRPKRWYPRNSEVSIREATQAAFDAKNDGDAIGALTSLWGVQLRTATAILHWLRPTEFPILDVRVVGALGEGEPKSWETVAYYSRIASRVRGLAARHRLTLRVIDRALWAWQWDQAKARRCAG